MSLQEPLQAKLGDLKNELKDVKKTIKELEKALKEANLAARADLQEQGASRPDYARLEDENAKLKNELAELKKMPDLSNLEDFEKTFKASVLAYVSNSVVVKQAATDVLKEAQTALTELATKKEISVKAQLMAIRENKTLGGFLGATSRSDADVAVLKREKAELVNTVDQLQKQNKALQKTLKATTDLVSQKDAQIAELQKNQEGLKLANDSFCLGQASMLSELVRSGRLYIEPKGQSLLAGLNDYMGGGYSADYFAGIKSGLLSYTPAVHALKNDLEYTR